MYSYGREFTVGTSASDWILPESFTSLRRFHTSISSTALIYTFVGLQPCSCLSLVNTFLNTTRLQIKISYTIAWVTQLGSRLRKKDLLSFWKIKQAFGTENVSTQAFRSGRAGFISVCTTFFVHTLMFWIKHVYIAYIEISLFFFHPGHPCENLSVLDITSSCQIVPCSSLWVAS